MAGTLNNKVVKLVNTPQGVEYIVLGCIKRKKGQSLLKDVISGKSILAGSSPALVSKNPTVASKNFAERAEVQR